MNSRIISIMLVLTIVIFSQYAEAKGGERKKAREEFHKEMHALRQEKRDQIKAINVKFKKVGEKKWKAFKESMASARAEKKEGE